MCSRPRELNAQTDNYCLKRVGYELWYVFSQKICRKLVRDDPVVQKDVCCILRGYCDVPYSPSQFGVSVCQISSVLIDGFRLW